MRFPTSSKRALMVSAFKVLVVTINPKPITASRAGSGVVTTSPVTPTITGGKEPYNTVWARVSGASFTISTDGSTATFSGSVTAGNTAVGVYRCTVTDDRGVVAYDEVTVELTAEIPPLTASVSPPNASGSRTGSGSVSSNNVTVTASGGDGSYSYSWTKVSGQTLTVSNPTGPTTTFSHSNVPAGQTYEAVYRCTITDGGGRTTTVDVNVTLVANYAPLTASASPSSVSASSTSSTSQTLTTNQSTATATGGDGSYTYQWEHVSGTALTVVNPNSATTAFRTTLSPGQSRSAVYRCKVTDGLGNVAYTNNVSVSINLSYPALGGSVSPSSGSGSRNGEGTCTSNSFTANGSGGVPPYNYEWGNAAATPNSRYSQSTTFSVVLANGQTYNASAYCIIRDSVGQSHTVYFSINFVSNYVEPTPLSVSLSPSPAYGMVSVPFFSPTYVDVSVTATPINGVPPYSYTWQHVSGDLFGMINPNSATCTFGTTMDPGLVRTGVYRCTVVDGASAVAYQDVEVTLHVQFTV